MSLIKRSPSNDNPTAQGRRDGPSRAPEVGRRVSNRNPASPSEHTASGIVPAERYAIPRPKQRVYVPSRDQQLFLEDELKTRSLPYKHVQNIKFVEGLDQNANFGTKIAFKRGHPAVTQGNTIYVQPDRFDSVTSFAEDTPFEEVYHTAQFAQDGNSAFYNKYVLSILGGIMSGLGPRDGNVQEAFAEGQAKKMLEAYRTRGKRERWGE